MKLRIQSLFQGLFRGRPVDDKPSLDEQRLLAYQKHCKNPHLSAVENWNWASEAWPLIKTRALFYSRLNPKNSPADNWFAAERDILKGISAVELENIETRIRGMIQHENDLLNHRIQWFLVINGFLLAATATLLAKAIPEIFMLRVLSGVGLAICISFYFSLGIGRRGVGRLSQMWEHYRDLHYKIFRHEEPSGCHQVGVLGWRANPIASRLAPWYALPIIFGSVWGTMLLRVVPKVNSLIIVLLDRLNII